MPPLDGSDCAPRARTRPTLKNAVSGALAPARCGLETDHAHAKLSGMLELFDKLTAPALRARQVPPLSVRIRQLQHPPKQVPLIRILEGQKAPAGCVPAAQNILLQCRLPGRRRGLFSHGGCSLPGRSWRR